MTTEEKLADIALLAKEAMGWTVMTDKKLGLVLMHPSVGRQREFRTSGVYDLGVLPWNPFLSITAAFELMNALGKKEIYLTLENGVLGEVFAARFGHAPEVRDTYLPRTIALAAVAYFQSKDHCNDRNCAISYPHTSHSSH